MKDDSPAPPAVPPAPYYLPFPPTADEGEIDLTGIWRGLTSRKWLIFGVTLLVTAAATAAAFLMTPVYRAEVVMVPASEQDQKALSSIAGQLGGLASMVGVDLGGAGADVNVSVATLESRDFTYAFVRDHDLLPVLFSDLWDAPSGTWKVDDPTEVPTLWDAYKLFEEDIRFVTKDGETGLVTLAIEWKDPQVAVRWANELVARVNRHRQKEAIQEAEKSIAYLQEQLRKTTVTEIQQAMYGLIEAQTKTIMLANARDQYAFKIIDPAVPADPDDFVKPKRPLLVALGVFGGGFLGILLALAREYASRSREEETSTESTPAAQA